ncbi:MAG: DAK2 domain-containing protein [Anaerolineae bacterium]|nr:DAK2 domain-containing protein [Anaerolineae bacterium]
MVAVNPTLTRQRYPLAPALSADGRAIRHALRAALDWLEKHYEAINQLNVFPVPDGDTGTNMLLTVRAAYHAIANDESAAAGAVAERLAHGALHGSRGNSGTVLSQFMRGFADALRSAPAFDGPQLAAAFKQAAQAGYRTFQKPVEGTILTVAREMAEEAEVAARSVRDMRIILKRALERGKRALAATPELLPILKKAGVVDSGGQGLIVLLEGMVRYLYGKAPDDPGDDAAILAPAALDLAALEDAFDLSEERDDGGFGFDVQFVVRGHHLDVNEVRRTIEGMGRSAIVVGDSGLIKVHVHVKDPEMALGYGRRLGALEDVVIEDMQAQSESYAASRLRAANPDRCQECIAVVVVAPGDGLRALFIDQGAAAVISGGQTMNPSAGELVDAITALDAHHVIVLPNNGNVILTAEQAAQLAAAESGQEVRVLPTRSAPQGIAAMLGFLPEGDAGEVLRLMGDSAWRVRTGEITRATRSLALDDLTVQAGQFIGLIDDQLSAAGGDLERVLFDVLDRMIHAEHEIVTLYRGEPLGEAEARALLDSLRARYPAQEFELLWGGQPHYHLVLSVE